MQVSGALMLRPVEWTEEEAQTFRRAVDALRDTRGWSQKELGAALGVSGSLVGQWLRGVGEPPRHRVFELEEEFNLRPGTLSRIMGYLPLNAKPARTVTEAIDADSALTEPEREVLRSVYAGVRRRKAL